MPTVNTYKYSSILGICLVLLLFGSPNLLLATQHFIKGFFYAGLLDIFHFLITSGVFLLPAVLFNLQIKRYLLYISPLFALVPLFLFNVAIYDKLPTRSIFYILFEVQKFELIEFLSGIYFWKILMLILPISVILIGQFLIQSNLVSDKKFKLKFVVFYLALFLITISFKTVQRKTIDNTLKISFKTYLRGSPINLSIRFYKALKTFKKDNAVNINNSNLHVFRESDINSREIYVLVIGESSRFKNWNLNGYSRNTSPQLQKTKNIISYKNTISPSFNTNKSVPIILTTQNTQNLNDTLVYTSIIEIFKQASFTTYWIGNQPIKGGPIGSISKDSDKILELDYKKHSKFDGELLDQVGAILSKKQQKTLIIIHTLGSHYPYQNRYPESFYLFTPTIEQNLHIPLNKKHKNAIINSYDNSIAYTDFFLSELIDLINIDSAISSLTYVSDHGENLFDDKNIGFGRGYGKYSPQLFHIPLFFWASKELIANNQVKWETLVKNDSIKSTTEGILYTFTDLAGVYWSNFDSTKSFANKYCREKERFFLDKNKLLDYDTFFNLESEK